MTNKPFGTLYIGVTSNLVTRVSQHKNGTGSSFCKRYGLTRLVYAEEHARIDEAIAREKNDEGVEPELEVTPDHGAEP
jgi:putative endonuclease